MPKCPIDGKRCYIKKVYVDGYSGLGEEPDTCRHGKFISGFQKCPAMSHITNNEGSE